jgi:hypothetical protein
MWSSEYMLSGEVKESVDCGIQVGTVYGEKPLPRLNVCILLTPVPGGIYLFK